MHDCDDWRWPEKEGGKGGELCPLKQPEQGVVGESGYHDYDFECTAEGTID